MLDIPITIQEVMPQHEKPTLTEIFEVVLGYLRNRDDIVVFGAHAVNEYLDIDARRTTSDIDIMSTNTDRVVKELIKLLHDRLHIAVRLREVADGRGLRLYQQRKNDKNRNLVDIRYVDKLPAHMEYDGIMFARPEDLVVMKLVSFVARRHTVKGISDRLDIQRLLLAYPAYRSPDGPVAERLRSADRKVVAAWHEMLAERIQEADDDEY